ncbi:hypothetical protein BDB00DRAFT_926108 [Zychaea mexicana]|uniref:uncharacterized protein n=1 Tax=Zychaea mexicana TaxID=64656 RepID=UPI0022FE0A34|nr:uncharacterized protein BDB00DRAFT_926108 [Zychaea mexicana]KAI9497236.1 hypothetical protein BDB00DRAFT_926108 [Zychaea mexicana]
MPFPPSSPNSFPHYILNEDPRFIAIHQSMKEQQQPHSLSRSKSTGSSSMAYNSTNVPPRRLSSGSACEVCRKRKTKCDGGNPCAFCAANGIECVHRATRRKKSSLAIGSTTSTFDNPTTTNSSRTIAITNTSTNFVSRNHTAASSTSNCSSNSNNSNNIDSVMSARATTTTTTTTIPTAAAADITPTPSAASAMDIGRTVPPGSAGISIGDNAAGTAIIGGAPSWVKELEGPSRSNLSKQTSCPSLIVTTHWSPTTPPPPSLTPNDQPRGYIAVTAAHPLGSDSRRVHRAKEEIPSMMDQLSCRTFSAAAFVDHRTNYPIYPLSSSTTTSNRSDIRASSSSSSSPSSTSPSFRADAQNF